MSTLQYIVFPYSDLEEVPQEELDKRNLVPRISLNGKKALMKAEHYAEIFASKMIMTLSEDGETPIVSYPYPVYEGEELNALLASSKWSSSDSVL
jgi:hypothetical protein